jgi:hypothetical protein
METTMGRVFDIFAAIVTVATVAVVVQSPNSGPIIKAWGDAFGGSLRAAMGK